METTDQVTVSQAALNELEQRALTMNVKLLGLLRLLDSGQMDRAKSVAGLLQEANWTQRKAIIAAGAVDSIEATEEGRMLVRKAQG